MSDLTPQCMAALQQLREYTLDPYHGLPEDLFLFISGLIPVVNVDLLIVNEKGQLLLSRRNDEFFEKSWHIPGGCMRYGESFEARIQQTAVREIGTQVQMEKEPVAIRNVIRGENPELKYPRERGHNVAILYRCKLPAGFEIENGDKTEEENGYLKWFDKLPEDFMQIQKVYLDVLGLWRR